MLRLKTQDGWWLVTHPDHARLAGAFAESWGNELFASPEPRIPVLKGIARHDDGWTARDVMPQITRQGKPSAFSVELVGKYSAFEEIDLVDYLAVRDRAVRLMAGEDPYAAVLISMHTYSLLSEHADRSTIAPDQLPLLDHFLDEQRKFQGTLREQIVGDSRFGPAEISDAQILDQFHLLQATDNLSLLTCVDFRQPAHLLHALRLRSGARQRIEVSSTGLRHFVLSPYPFADASLVFQFPARHVEGDAFSSPQELQQKFNAAKVEMLPVTLSAA
jgi:hypothetical protein